MTHHEKISLLEEMLELDEGILNEDTALAGIEQWDSMAALSLIVLMDENFNKILTGAQIKEFKSIQDILDLME